MSNPSPKLRPAAEKATHFATDHLRGDLRRRSVRGGAVTASAQAAKFVLRFGSTAVLARLLTPEDYGLIAMTAVIVGFVGIFKDSGLSAATIQRDELSHAQVSTLFWINALLGCLLGGGLMLGAPAVAWFYQEPRLTGVTTALASSFILSGFTVQHTALLRRQMRFKTLAVIEIASLVAGILTAIFMASAGFAYWSLVGLTLGMALANLVAVWLANRWRPGLPRRAAGVRGMLRFGTDILSFSVVNYFARNGDNLMIGWCWGAGTLGFYDKAYNLLLFPVQQINAPLAAVAVPALARCKADKAELCRYYFSLHRLIASACIPAIVGLALFADQVVHLWLGPRWAEAAVLFRLLAPAALLGALSNPSGWLLMSLGLTARYRNLGWVCSTLVVLAFGLGLSWGAQGVALAYSLTGILLFVPTWWWVLQGTGISLVRFLRNLVPAAVSSAVAACVAGGVLFLSPPAFIDPLRSLVAAALFGGVYAAFLLGVFGERELLRKVLAALRSKPQPQAPSHP